MQIKENMVVTMDYTLKDGQGNLIESSNGQEPVMYIHGTGSIIPGLENALTGKKVGDRVDVKVGPADAYGERDDSLVQKVPREQFDVDEIQPGMQFQMETEEGWAVVTVAALDDKEVTIDGNHPLAGMDLQFEVSVVDVREATEEELEHGHVHGDDCCGH